MIAFSLFEVPGEKENDEKWAKWLFVSQRFLCIFMIICLTMSTNLSFEYVVCTNMSFSYGEIQEWDSIHPLLEKPCALMIIL
jgi:hypothetical protein